MLSIILLQCLLLKIVVCISNHPILIVVSYDGFRYNLFQKGLTPYMLKLRQEGTYADYMQNVFPTKTFPNHHSIATGLYPESHGVIDNTFYDPKLEKVIMFGEDMYKYNLDIQPIWRLNEEAGKGRHSGIMMWPGATFPYQDKLPSHMQTFDSTVNYFDRVDTIIKWILDPYKPANLVMFYIEEPDQLAHIYGPDSEIADEMLKTLDNLTMYLDQKLKKNKLHNRVNVVYLSDHGIMSVSPPNIIDITNYLQNVTYQIAGTTPILHIIPSEDEKNEIYESLKAGSRINKHFRVYRKKQLLERWHFKNNDRIGPIVAIADEGYAFQDLEETIKKYVNKYDIQVSSTSNFGVHGYDYTVPQMRPFFMATGPKIKKRYKLPIFKIVDLFPYFCELLEIQPTPNNGSLGIVSSSLLIRKQRSVISTLLKIVGGICLALFLIICGIAITVFLIKRQQTITTNAALNKRFQQNFHHSTIEAQHLLEAEDA